MADTKASTGKGVKFSLGNGATPTEVFEALAEVTNIDAGGVTLDTTDATHLGSGDYDEFIAVIMRQEPVTITINYVPSGTDETALMTAFAAQAFRGYKITWPSTATLSWKGLMTGFKINGLTRTGKMEATATFKPRGASTRAPGA